jgi:pyrimidine oxygenase
LADRYRDGVDMGAVTTMLSNWGVPPERLAETAARQGAFMTRTVIGAPATCGAQIRDLVETCELDGLMLIFPDYETGLSMFGAEILPDLREAYP